MASGKGGYDCDFVEDPPKRLECPICLQTVREPHVITCCGHQFCRLCIEQVRLQGKPCPLCNEPSYTLFLHKGVEREVKALRVRCPQKELGCEWVGELGGLERHVSPGAGPSASGRGEGCQYAEVECVYQCGERLQRRFIVLHEAELCTRRPVEAQLASVTRKLQEAREENISLRGAQVRMREQQMKQEEETKKLSERLDTVFNSLKAENNALREELCQAEGELSEVQQKLEEEQKTTRALSEELRQGLVKLNQHEEKYGHLESRLTPTLPFLFTVDNYEHLKKHSIRWCSDSFYSHPQGYKLCVEVFPGGYGTGKGSHMSVYVCLMRGEYDDSLKWPFLGSVEIQLFHYLTETWEDVTAIPFPKSLPIERPSMNYIANIALRYPTFLSNTELKKYLAEGTLKLRVSNVELLH